MINRYDAREPADRPVRPSGAVLFGHTVETGGLDSFDRLRAGLRLGDDMAGVHRSRGNRRTLRAVVIDDQELQGASFAAARRGWLGRPGFGGPGLNTGWHRGSPFRVVRRNRYASGASSA